MTCSCRPWKDTKLSEHLLDQTQAPCLSSMNLYSLVHTCFSLFSMSCLLIALNHSQKVFMVGIVPCSRIYATARCAIVNNTNTYCPELIFNHKNQTRHTRVSCHIAEDTVMGTQSTINSPSSAVLPGEADTHLSPAKWVDFSAHWACSWETPCKVQQKLLSSSWTTLAITIHYSTSIYCTVLWWTRKCLGPEI